jgi:hypothetical protein
MTRLDGAERRRQRIAEIARMVHAALYEARNIGWISLSRTVTKIMIGTGLTRKTVVGILKLLADDNQFELDEKGDKIKKAQEG